MTLFGDLLGLNEVLDTPVRSLSLGQRMRADLAAALLHDPKLLFLDEPTIGLDVVAKERIREFIRAINRERGTTVILTTHDLGDVEKLCERVIMIDRGRIMYDGALEMLRRRFGEGRVLVVDFESVPADIALPNAQLIRIVGNRAWLRVSGEAAPSAGNGAGMAGVVGELFRRYQVLDLSVQEPEIEEVVRRIYEGHLLGG
jgi:ABC-2 type transport system ATP-binding protein